MKKNPSKKTLWVTSTSLSKYDGQEYIQTAISFEGKKTNIGKAAIDGGYNDFPCFSEFKINLGKTSPGKSQELLTSKNLQKTPSELTTIFFETILKSIANIDPTQDNSQTKIIIAEPLAFQVDGKNEWITNYRSHLKRILHNFGEIDFLPEPFAVYQYYRYGLKHAILQESKMHVALIIDFGGGTFDASIVASKKDGDISESGANSRPLAADSTPIGGFYINRIIAREIFKDASDHRAGDKMNIVRFFESLASSNPNPQSGLSASEKSNLEINLWKVMRNIEAAKIRLVNKIHDWNLKAECNETVELQVPADPLDNNSQWSSILLSGHRLRNLFRQEVWDKHLKKTLFKVFERATSDIDEKPITVTLISGGSSNIKWIEKLLLQDFSKFLTIAKPIPLSESFQEIVAKGLAIECARRHYAVDTEFEGVTYNPIRLALNPDGKGCELPKFRSIGEVVNMNGLHNGDLLPSAHALKELIDHPIVWKTRLNHPPKSFLEYFFIRPIDATPTECKDEVINDSFNISSTKVATPKDTPFEQHIKVEITIKADGTVTPRFIYKSKDTTNDKPEFAVTGQPFAIDATSFEPRKATTKYIGFDFGTSNSSIACLTNESIEWIERNRVGDTEDLSELVDNLPGPISEATKRFLCVSNGDKNSLWREAFESMLAFTAYSLVAEANQYGKAPSLLKGFQHRSFGPLKALIIGCTSLKHDGELLKIVAPLLLEHEWLNKAIDSCNNEKHDKYSIPDEEKSRILTKMAKIIIAIMERFYFCSFASIQKKKFSTQKFTAILESAQGSWPYMDRLSCEIDLQPGTESVFLISRDTGKSIPLLPLIFVDLDTNNDQPIYFFYDATETADGNPIYKTANKKEAKPCSDLKEYIQEFKQGKLIPDTINVQFTFTSD